MLETIHGEWKSEFGVSCARETMQTWGCCAVAPDVKIASLENVLGAAGSICYSFFGGNFPMFRLRSYLCMMAVPIVGAAILGVPTLARADFELRYSINGGAFTTITSPTPFITTQVGGLTISATGSASSTSSISTMDLNVGGVSSTALTLVVQLWGNPAITLPPPELLSYVMNGSVLPTTSGSITEQIWTTNNSTPFDTTNLVTGTSGPKTPNTTGSFIFNGNPPGYSVEEQTTVTLTAGGSISSDDNLQIVPTPAPAAMVLLLSGTPVFGGLAWLRRRKATRAA